MHTLAVALDAFYPKERLAITQSQARISYLFGNETLLSLKVGFDQL
jgi:hypothetical protein